MNKFTALDSKVNLGLILLFFFLGVISSIELPGLYMDAINPDYLVVRIVQEDISELPAMLLRSNILDSSWRFPILPGAPYHGAQHLYLGLPFYYLFGTNIVTARLFHALFGAIILISAYTILIRGGCRKSIAFLTLAALALDGTFIMAFRTQSYITLAPLAWLLVAILFIIGAVHQENSNWRNVGLFFSGFFYGLSIYGYFIYLFFAPAFIILLFLLLRNSPLLPRSFKLWIIGTLLPLALYPYAYLSMYVDYRGMGGLKQTFQTSADLLSSLDKSVYLFFIPIFLIFTSLLLWRFRLKALLLMATVTIGFCLSVIIFLEWRHFVDLIIKLDQKLNILGPELGIVGRIMHVFRLLSMTIANETHHQNIFNSSLQVPFARFKEALLLSPIVIIPSVTLTHRDLKCFKWFSVVLLFILSYLFVCLFFGRRLQGHHYVVLIPLIYLATALSINGILCTVKSLNSDSSHSTIFKRAAASISMILLFALIAINIKGQFFTQRLLRETGGVGYYSDALNLLSDIAVRSPRKEHYIFPEWGFFTPFAFLTGGKVGYSLEIDRKKIISKLCEGTDVILALWGNDRDQGFMDISERVGLDKPKIQEFRQRNGETVFVTGKYSYPSQPAFCED